jgi:putative transposase
MEQLWGHSRAANKPSCLTVDGILGQLANERKKPEGIYRQFVKAGIRSESIWKDLRGQSILGGDPFVKRLKDHLVGKEAIPEIPKAQRFMARPPLEKIFTSEVIRKKDLRNHGIWQAVERHGYTQKEVSDQLGLHFSSISRIIRKEPNEKMLKK